MKLKIPSFKLDWNHIGNDLVFLGIAGAILGVLAWKGFSWLGIFSYNGLPESDVLSKYNRFQKEYTVFSKVGGHNPFLGGYFERGVAFPKKGGIPYYFHYSNNGKGKAEFSLYPEFLETWTTDSGILGIPKYFTQEVKV